MSQVQSITEANVSIGIAAHAAGISSRALRLALGSGGKVPLLGKVDRHAVGTWRRFSPVDVPRLAVLSRLLNHGLTVSAAARVISSTIDQRLLGLTLCGIDLPNQLILTRFHGALHVSMTEVGGYVARIVPCGTLPDYRHDTTILLDLETIASTALSRLSRPRSIPSTKDSSK